MHPDSQWRAEEERFLEHLHFVGYTTDSEPDPHGWRFATHSMAPPLGFRAGPHFLCLHAEYPAGCHEAAVHRALLREVNRFNATQWLIRCSLVTRTSGPGAQLWIRLQANLPRDLPAQELGACLFTWIRESTYIERATRLWAAVSVDAHATEDGSHGTIDDHPTQTT